MKKLFYVILLLLISLFLCVTTYAQQSNNYNNINYSYIRYFANREFDSNNTDLKFSEELLSGESASDYYYEVKYNYYDDTLAFAYVYNGKRIFYYIPVALNNLSIEEKSYSNNNKSLLYHDDNGKIYLIEKFEGNVITSVTRYNSEGERKISEVYRNGLILTVSYSNESSKPVVIQTFDEIGYPVSTEITIENLKNQDDYVNIQIDEKKEIKYVNEYVNNSRVKVFEYKKNILYKIYYYNEEGLIYKFEVFDENGLIIFVYNDESEENNDG